MTQKGRCPCIAHGNESYSDGDWILSFTLVPGCSICGACICSTVIMDSGVKDRWRYFVARNIDCEFCYSEHPGRHIADEDGPETEANEGLICSEPEALAVTVTDGTTPENKKKGKRNNLERIGDDFIQEMKRLWKKEDSGRDGGSSSVMRTLTFRTARKGRYRQRYEV